jgi:hypothetical protein
MCRSVNSMLTVGWHRHGPLQGSCIPFVPAAQSCCCGQITAFCAGVVLVAVSHITFEDVPVWSERCVGVVCARAAADG